MQIPHLPAVFAVGLSAWPEDFAFLYRLSRFPLYLCTPGPDALQAVPDDEMPRQPGACVRVCVYSVRVCVCVVYERAVIGVISRVVVELSDQYSCRAQTRVG